MTVHNQWQLSRAVRGGAVAGLVSGAILVAFLAVMNAMNGRDVWAGLKFAGFPFLGKRALLHGPDPVAVLVGVLDHLAVSVFWGVAFGLLSFGLSRGLTLLAGVIWGIVVWLGMLYVALPVLGFPAGGNSPLPIAIFTHVLFGVILAAAFLPYQRELPPVGRRGTHAH